MNNGELESKQDIEIVDFKEAKFSIGVNCITGCGNTISMEWRGDKATYAAMCLDCKKAFKRLREDGV